MRMKKRRKNPVSAESNIPQIGYLFINEKNAESLKLILKSIDNVIEYYNMLYDASKKRIESILSLLIYSEVSS